jgi:hypothetical protein
MVGSCFCESDPQPLLGGSLDQSLLHFPVPSRRPMTGISLQATVLSASRWQFNPFRAELTPVRCGVQQRCSVTNEFVLDELRHIDLAKEPATITLSNVDRIVGMVETTRIEAKTAMGAIEVSVESIAGIVFHTNLPVEVFRIGLVAYYPFD